MHSSGSSCGERSRVQQAQADLQKKPQARGARLGLGQNGHGGDGGVPVAINHAIASSSPPVTTSTLSRFLTLIRAPRQRLNVPPLPLHPQGQRPVVNAANRFLAAGGFAAA